MFSDSNAKLLVSVEKLAVVCLAEVTGETASAVTMAFNLKKIQ